MRVQGAATARESERADFGRVAGAFFSKYGMVFAVVLLMTIVALLTNRFLTPANLLNVLRQISLTAILGAGMTVVIISGGIDLSVGATIALTSCVMANILLATRSLWLTCAAGLGVGLVVGLSNGLFISKMHIEPFIVTLASQTILRGVTLLYTNAQPISIYSVPQFGYLGQGYWGPIPIPVYFMFATFGFTFFMLRKTRFGRYVYAIGGNERAAHLAGIKVERCKILIYMLSGLLAALTSVLLTSRLLSGVPTLGGGYEMIAITMTILGGTSFAGGQGKIWNTILGATILGTLSNGMNLLNLSPFYQDISTGLVILLAVAADRYAHRRDI